MLLKDFPKDMPFVVVRTTRKGGAFKAGDRGQYLHDGCITVIGVAGWIEHSDAETLGTTTHVVPDIERVSARIKAIEVELHVYKAKHARMKALVGDTTSATDNGPTTQTEGTK